MEIPCVRHQDEPTWRELQTVLEIQQGLFVPPQLQELRTSPNESEPPDLLEYLHFWLEILCHRKTHTPEHSILQRFSPLF